ALDDPQRDVHGLVLLQDGASVVRLQRADAILRLAAGALALAPPPLTVRSPPEPASGVVAVAGAPMPRAGRVGQDGLVARRTGSAVGPSDRYRSHRRA